MESKSLLDQLSSLSLAAYRHQLAHPEESDVVLSRPFLDFSYALCEAKSDRSFLRSFCRSPSNASLLQFGKTKLINSLIFKQLLSYALDAIVNEFNSLECFSAWDHYLFSSHIQLQDSPGWFRSAFWDINSHTHNFAAKFIRSDLKYTAGNSGNGPIVFVFKGPAAFAHFENFRKYLDTICRCFPPDLFRVIFLDLISSKAPSLPCKVFALGDKNPLDKLNAYSAILFQTNARASIWIACVQNLGLYMFSRFCSKQGYWSMKYHSVYSSNIDLNLRTSTLSLPSSIDGLTWLGMPTDFSSLISFDHHDDLDYGSHLQHWASSVDLPNVVTLGREIKINNPTFTGLIKSLASSIKFSYSGRRSLPALNANAGSCEQASIYLGWLDRQSIDLAISSSIVYLDSFPFGGGHTCFYALSLKRPILMLDTHENRRCSFMMHLVDLLEAFAVNVLDYQEYGIYSHQDQITGLMHSVSARNHEALEKLISIQEKQHSIFLRFSQQTNYEKQIIHSMNYF